MRRRSPGVNPTNDDAGAGVARGGRDRSDDGRKR
jgi:hypothetical protein